MFGIDVDPRGLPVGTYTGTVTVTASTSAVPESPFVLPVTVRIMERLYNVYVTVVAKNFR